MNNELSECITALLLHGFEDTNRTFDGVARYKRGPLVCRLRVEELSSCPCPKVQSKWFHHGPRVKVCGEAVGLDDMLETLHNLEREFDL